MSWLATCWARAWLDTGLGPGERDIPRPIEYIKLDRSAIREKDGKLSFRFMEPLEEAVYLDQVRLLAVDHPADLDVYPNEYFASNPPYPEFKVVVSKNEDARPPAGAWDEHGHNVLPDLLAHRYFGDFALTHSWALPSRTAWNSISASPTAAARCGCCCMARSNTFRRTACMPRRKPACRRSRRMSRRVGRVKGKWVRVVDDMGFPAGGPRTMTADLTGKLPPGTQKIRITTNLQIYWDNILIEPDSQIRSQDRRPHA